MGGWLAGWMNGLMGGWVDGWIDCIGSGGGSMNKIVDGLRAREGGINRWKE
mgnify:CR=1 FL=1